jgi:hypothetical protein
MTIEEFASLRRGANVMRSWKHKAEIAQKQLKAANDAGNYDEAYVVSHCMSEYMMCEENCYEVLSAIVGRDYPRR